MYVNFSITGNLAVTSNSDLNGSLDVSGAAVFSNSLDLIGAMTIGSDLNITSNTIVSGSLNVIGASIISNTLDITSNVTIAGTLQVTGQANINNIALNWEKISTTNVVTNALDPDISVTMVSTTGADFLVLSNGSFIGQTKKIILSSDGGDLIVTPVNFAEATGLTFDAQMDSVELLFDGTNWNMISANSVATN